ncbi:MAG: aminotransferase class V-fold PLP-dependent enzyme [Rhodobacteraceae bacterium]|nr:aminotransferase class V-fold PLP-dependent enzyme [Paracoccaceae bacterium]
MSGRVYLDWNATAPLRPEARAAMVAALDVVGNPSSVHAEGRAAKALVERARAQVAALVGCAPDEVVFTGGATEAAQVLAGLPGPLVVDACAHDALWSRADERRDAVGPATFALGLANSETGILAAPPVRGADGGFAVAGVACDRILLDVTQAVGRVPFAFSWSGADFAILSAHKLGGPKGVGALIVRGGVDIAPLARGGGQELGRRAGTENVAGIAGFGAAAEAALRDLDAGLWDEVARLRIILETAIEAASPSTILVGKGDARLPNTSCLVAPGWRGETQVMAMDLAGFAVSAGSACSSGKVRPSRVLRAMGFSEVEAAAAIRVSLGPATTQDEVERFAAAWVAAERKYRARAA